MHQCTGKIFFFFFRGEEEREGRACEDNPSVEKWHLRNDVKSIIWGETLWRSGGRKNEWHNVSDNLICYSAPFSRQINFTSGQGQSKCKQSLPCVPVSLLRCNESLWWLFCFPPSLVSTCSPRSFVAVPDPAQRWVRREWEVPDRVSLRLPRKLFSAGLH